jgi:hypothetical protein
MAGLSVTQKEIAFCDFFIQLFVLIPWITESIEKRSAIESSDSN